jgi:hypothetical protein
VLVAVLVGLTIVVFASVLWVGGIHALYGLAAGVSMTIVLAYAFWAIVEGSGARSAVIGAIGEDLTAGELDRLGRGWRRIDSVPFGSNFDVDHVLVSDRGVFAVETKYTARPWSSSSIELQRAAANARSKARKIKLLLDGSGRPSVHAVLVVWGPGARALPRELLTVEGVMVSRGFSDGALNAYLEGRPRVLEQSSVDVIFDAVMHHTTRTEGANRARTSDGAYS